ncbi:Scr1 family TA system antitoxin-like transcriptional regulator [Micromonospora echinospora]|uniref:Scr1 family TA system antitoxin-like transcriptional regulator n=1 Tax=Micromonospora echinospora TaxID=1877 RepID=UPI0033EEEAC1
MQVGLVIPKRQDRTARLKPGRRDVGHLPWMRLDRRSNPPLPLPVKPTLSIRILPLTARFHPPSSWWRLHHPYPEQGNADEHEPPTIYQKSLTNRALFDGPADVEAYETVWAKLRAAALDETGTRDLLIDAAKTSKDLRKDHDLRLAVRPGDGQPAPSNAYLPIGNTVMTRTNVPVPVDQRTHRGCRTARLQ